MFVVQNRQGSSTNQKKDITAQVLSNGDDSAALNIRWEIGSFYFSGGGVQAVKGRSTAKCNRSYSTNPDVTVAVFKKGVENALTKRSRVIGIVQVMGELHVDRVKTGNAVTIGRPDIALSVCHQVPDIIFL